MSTGTYFVYPASSAGGGGGGTLSSISFSVGTFDSQTPTANGASVSSNSIFFQSASSTLPGMVSSAVQTFSGVKTFSSNVITQAQLQIADGTQAAPGIAFASDQSSGLMRFGPAEMYVMSSGSLAFDILNLGGGVVNIGVNSSASLSSSTPFSIQRNVNASIFNLFQNVSNLTASGAVWILRSGTSSNDVTLENYAKLNAGYLIETGILSASGNLLNLNVMSEFADGRVRFNIGGRTLATEVAKISSASFIINPGRSFAMTGSSTGGFQVFSAGSSTTFYSLTMPPIQGTANQFMSNDGSGNLTWVTHSSATLIGSVSLTNQVSGVLPNANMSSVALSNAAQVTGSISLTNQVVNNLPLTQVSGQLAIANGGTAATSSGQAFLNISPTTTSGDLIISSGTSGQVLTRLTVGAGGQVLTVSTGSLIQSWQTLTAPTKQFFSGVSSSSYTTPTGCRFIKVTITGAGGGGGGAATAAASAGAGSGGGGGGTVVRYFSPTPGQVFTYSIGAGGAGGTAGNNPGILGGNTWFSFTTNSTTGVGGSPGAGSPAGTLGFTGGGGAGGTTLGVLDYAIVGGYGLPGIFLAATQALSGGGGFSSYGSGGAPIEGSGTGLIGAGIGAGGSGGAQINNAAAQGGGPGKDGGILVEEFYQ